MDFFKTFDIKEGSYLDGEGITTIGGGDGGLSGRCTGLVCPPRICSIVSKLIINSFLVFYNYIKKIKKVNYNS